MHEKFLYDGWNLIGAFSGTDSAVIRSFLWALDLSGAQAGPANVQGADGVGGCLFFTQHSTPQPSTHWAAYDGNGNVMALVDGKTGSTSARYEYDPFGQTIRASGTMATVNPVRFSSKVVDDETDYAYYGYRYLNPNAGRWLSRDPIEELGGVNINAFGLNDLLNLIDALGEKTLTAGPVPLPDPVPAPGQPIRNVAQISATLTYPDDTCSGTATVSVTLDSLGNPGTQVALGNRPVISPTAASGNYANGTLTVTYNINLPCTGDGPCNVSSQGEVTIAANLQIFDDGAARTLQAFARYKVELLGGCGCYYYDRDNSSLDVGFGRRPQP